MSRDHTQSKKSDKILIVVNENLTPLLGAAVIQQMGLIEVHEENFEKVAAARIASTKQQTAQEIIEKYRDVFEGDLGTLEGLQHLDVDPSVPPPLHHRNECHSPLSPCSKPSLID